MSKDARICQAALGLLLKAVLLAARWAGHIRRRSLELGAADSGSDARPNPRRSELLALRERIRQLESQVAIMRRQLRARAVRKRYTLRERLSILWHLETFQVPRRKVHEVFGIARSTLYRWLRGIEEQASPKKLPSSMASRTPHEIAEWVWDLAMANARWGRTRIALQLRCLKEIGRASCRERV
jgi:hypothetical protein